MVPAGQREQWRRLERGEGGMILVMPDDNDNFVISFDDLTRACKSWVETKEFLQHIKDLLSQLSDWLAARRPEIHGAFVGLNGDEITVVIVQRAARFAPEFEREVSELELRLEERTNLGARLISLPYSADSTVRSFVEPVYAWSPSKG